MGLSNKELEAFKIFHLVHAMVIQDRPTIPPIRQELEFSGLGKKELRPLVIKGLVREFSKIVSARDVRSSQGRMCYTLTDAGKALASELKLVEPKISASELARQQTENSAIAGPGNVASGLVGHSG